MVFNSLIYEKCVGSQEGRVLISALLPVFCCKFLQLVHFSSVPVPL